MSTLLDTVVSSARLLFFTAILTSCAAPSENLTDAQRAFISSEVETALREAYDLSKPNVSERMLALYPKSGRVISTTGGRASDSRDSLEAGIRYFWDNVGVNMRQPRWEWDRFYVDVLSPTAAAVTATYRIPHLNPSNQPHVLGGAMTAVLQKRDGRWVIVQEHLSDLPQNP
jgi:hypothetical protein